MARSENSVRYGIRSLLQRANGPGATRELVRMAGAPELLSVAPRNCSLRAEATVSRRRGAFRAVVSEGGSDTLYPRLTVNTIYVQSVVYPAFVRSTLSAPCFVGGSKSNTRSRRMCR